VIQPKIKTKLHEMYKSKITNKALKQC